MAKSFKEYLGLSTIRVGGLDSMQPMASLGDTPPKGQGGRDSRAMGLTANDKNPNDKHSRKLKIKTPAIKPDFRSDNEKNLKEEELEELSLQDVKKAAQRFAKGIYDKLKRMATTKQRYEYAAKVLQDVIDRKEVERAREGLPLRHDIGYYAAAVAQTFHDIDPKKLVKMVKEETIKETPLYNYMLEKGVIKE